MPYTPPTKQCPAASKSNSPALTRSQSSTNVLSQPTSPFSPEGRPTFPRSTSSTSYLSRHRRTPSLSKSSKDMAESTTITSPTRDAKAKVNGGENEGNPGPTRPPSIQQSPPPVNNAVIPPGAIMSPPDSMQTSSDDEASPRRTRGRPLENLAELQAAIRNIEQHRVSSPEGIKDESNDALDDVQATLPSCNALLGSRAMRERTRSTPPLSREARKISHSRSSTESSIVTELGSKTPSSAEDTETEADSPSRRPVMIRKKSGELVKPALRPSTYRRPSSMPGTPTYAKAVHFDAHLEQVRHFLQVDRPVAVSAGSSPAEGHESDDEFPFGQEDSYQSHAQNSDWEINVSNFPSDTPERRSLPVRVERVFLSSDKKTLIGSVAVANLAYHKSVAARFTLDYWKTTSEVMAEFNHDVRRKVEDGHDRFNFSIKLADLANLENKTLFFCVRYNVAGHEFWDNNNFMNFQVSFRKVAKSSNGRQAAQGLGARPLHSFSRPRSSPSTTGRPWSMPVSFDDFADGLDGKFDYSVFTQSASKIVSDSVSSKRGSEEDQARSAKAPLPDYPARRNNTTSQAFGNRYDFGASLSAAIQAANTESRKASSKETRSSGGNGNERSSTPTPAASSPIDSTSPKTKRASSTFTSSNKEKSTGVTSSGGGNSGQSTGLNPTTFPRPESYITEKPSQQSPSYLELIDKYCFVRSGPPRIVTEPT